MVYVERFTSDLYVEKRFDVLLYGDMHAHLQARALSSDGIRQLIAEAIKAYVVGRNASGTMSPRSSAVAR
ncbi:hypothetical protein ACIBG6_19215 [Streptomyces sp. NPDC050842]|uniref:hypothetical protein n=1 Tax=Streptomyces sp. NPDC050842 TaxID=3365636 RepID=UPI0037B79847